MAHLTSIIKRIPGMFEKAPMGIMRSVYRIVLPSAAFLMVIALYHYNALLLHLAVEMVCVVITGAIFMTAWYNRQALASSFFTIAGAGYLVVSILFFLHTVTYPGMSIFADMRDPNATIQFWIGARTVEGLALSAALMYARRTQADTLWLFIAMCSSFLIFMAILVWPVFPACYVPGRGVTPFKVGCEFAITLIFLGALRQLYRGGRIIEPEARALVAPAIWAAVLSEAAFTFHMAADGFFYIAAHYLKVLSVFWFFLALVQTGRARGRSIIGAKLKERNLMLKTLVQAIPDMVNYKDLRGRNMIANSAYTTFFGIKGASVSGQTIPVTETMTSTEEQRRREREVLEKGKSARYESVLRSAAGCTSHWDVRKIPVKDRRGNIMGVLSLARDISSFKQREFELQQSKAMLQAFLDGISDPMLMIDQTLHVIYANSAAASAYCFDSQAGRTHICSKIICTEKGRCEICRIETLMVDKKPASYELHRAHAHKVEKVYVYPFSDEATGLDGAVVRVADITEAKGLERHLIHSEKMNALGMLVAGMVHEINNPNSFISFNLPILKAYLDKVFKLLDSHPATSTHKDWFGMDYPAFRQEVFGLTDNLAHGSSRIDKIISNLKAMTHPKPILARKIVVDLLDVMDKAVVLCRGEIRKRVKVFEVTPYCDAIQINTDPEAIEQVIINLLINAAHAADKRDSWVRIQVFPSGESQNHAVIEVSDNGCGMEKETLDRIFDPFFTTKGPGVGTGLGLSVSYSMIRQLGGEILVDSKPGDGTRFRIVLPVEAEAEIEGGLDMGQSMDKGHGTIKNIVREEGMNDEPSYIGGR